MFKHLVQFVILLAVAWCVMTFTHESGHLIGGWSCGGTLKDADLVPWHLPYSTFEPNPQPLITVWCGPMLGVAIPLIVAMLIRRNWMWLIAHFCTLANGAYLATAWFSGESNLDTAKLFEHGAHPLTIAIYCAITIGFGYIGFRRECIRFLKPTINAQHTSHSESDTNSHRN